MKNKINLAHYPRDLGKWIIFPQPPYPYKRKLQDSKKKLQVIIHIWLFIYNK